MSRWIVLYVCLVLVPTIPAVDFVLWSYDAAMMPVSNFVCALPDEYIGT